MLLSSYEFDLNFFIPKKEIVSFLPIVCQFNMPEIPHETCLPGEYAQRKKTLSAKMWKKYPALKNPMA